MEGVMALHANPSLFLEMLQSQLAMEALRITGVLVSAPVLGGNNTAAQEAVTTQLTDVKNQLAVLVASGSFNASNTAQLADAVSALVADPSAINGAGASTALNALQTLASAGSVVSAATGTSVAASLSSLVAAVQLPNSVVSASVLTQIVGVVDSLSASLLTGVSANAPPIDITSAAIQMRVQVDAPGAGSRLFTQPLTANGSASAFAPLPASLFGGADTSAGVQTQFASFTFDPYDTSVTSGGAITRLAFSTPGGAAVEVSGLTTPIYFTIPPLASAPPAGAKPGCTFWDNTTRAYSSTGCAGIPYMRPAGHVLSWVPGFSVASDAEMARAWNISGPLLASCAAQLLDCSKDAAGRQTDVKLATNPANPFAPNGTIGCDASDESPKLVFVGSQCKLIQPGNAQACHWDNLNQARCMCMVFCSVRSSSDPAPMHTPAQAFAGSGCIAPASGIAQCACRHLTDFASKPTIATASLSDMVGLNPADIGARARVCAGSAVHHH
jgi:hypothetical protein